MKLVEVSDEFKAQPMTTDERLVFLFKRQLIAGRQLKLFLTMLEEKYGFGGVLGGINVEKEHSRGLTVDLVKDLKTYHIKPKDFDRINQQEQKTLQEKWSRMRQAKMAYETLRDEVQKQKGST